MFALPSVPELPLPNSKKLPILADIRLLNRLIRAVTVTGKSAYAATAQRQTSSKPGRWAVSGAKSFMSHYLSRVNRGFESVTLGALSAGPEVGRVAVNSLKVL